MTIPNAIEINEMARAAMHSADSFAAACEALQRELIVHGRDGVLRDVEVHLCEDGRTALLFVDYDSDSQLSAGFTLPWPTTEDEFDPAFYRALAERSQPPS